MITGSAWIAKFWPSGSAASASEQEFGALAGIAEQAGDPAATPFERRPPPRRVEHERGDPGLKREGGENHPRADRPAVRGEKQGDRQDQRDSGQAHQISHDLNPLFARSRAGRPSCPVRTAMRKRECDGSDKPSLRGASATRQSRHSACDRPSSGLPRYARNDGVVEFDPDQARRRRGRPRRRSGSALPTRRPGGRFSSPKAKITS